LGVGVIDPGAISIGVGTGGHCVAATTEPFLHPGLATSCQAHVVPARWEVEGIALATSATFQWLAEQLGAPDTDSANGGDRSRYDDIITESLHVPPGADGLLVLPTLNGAGTPHWKPNVRGAVLGLSSSHTRATLYRAFLEGICYEMRGVLNAVCELGIEATDLRVWGGPARSAAWVQMFSNVLGRPLTVSTEADAGLVGAGILGAVGVGLRSTIESAVGSMVKAGHLTEPDPDHAAIYDHGYERYLDALDLVMSHNS
jgi:xylulokinase